MTFAAKASSLRWRLPLLILAILASIGLAFAWTAYLQMHRALQVHAGERIRVATGQMADLFTRLPLLDCRESRLPPSPSSSVRATGEARRQPWTVRCLHSSNPQAKSR